MRSDFEKKDLRHLAGIENLWAQVAAQSTASYDVYDDVIETIKFVRGIAKQQGLLTGLPRGQGARTEEHKEFKKGVMEVLKFALFDREGREKYVQERQNLTSRISEMFAKLNAERNRGLSDEQAQLAYDKVCIIAVCGLYAFVVVSNELLQYRSTIRCAAFG